MGMREDQAASNARRSLLFWIWSPAWGLGLAYLGALLLAPLAMIFLLVAVAGTCVATAKLLSLPDYSGCSRVLGGLSYLAGASLVLFFGGWGVAMVARGGP
jgi:hypothetical protein